MSYIPHSSHDTAQLLAALKLNSIDELFRTVPKSVLFDKVPAVAPHLNEQKIQAFFAELAAKNQVSGPATGWSSFLGAGVYPHYVPAVVDALQSRGEFLTLYTPYQPEITQGNLQVTFEFQSLIANLVGMDLANASVFDGAHALVESVFMARRIKRGQKVLVSRAIHPQYLEVLATYASGLFTIELLPWDAKLGTCDFSAVKSFDDVFAVALQSPNYFGVLEDLTGLAQFAKDHGLISILVNNEPLAFAALKPPGHYGIDIYAGEGQGLGNPPNYGGPHLGMLATSKKHIRNIPGRLIGRTQDANGNPGYVITLTTREQHIRRERATSNMCTNQFLVALRTTIYLAWLGQRGMQRLAYENAKRMSYFLEKIAAQAQLKPHFAKTVFNEVTIDLTCDAQKVLQRLEQQKIIGGCCLQASGLPQALLLHFTELHDFEQIDRLVEALSQAVREVKAA